MRTLLSFWRIFVRAMQSLYSERMTIARFCQTVAHLALAFAVIIAIFPATNAFAQRIPDTLTCGGKFPVDLGTVLAGGTLLDTLFLFNAEASRDSVFKIKTLSDNEIRWTDSTGIHVPSGSETDFTMITFTPLAKSGKETKPIVIQPIADSDSCQTTFDMTVEIVGPDTNNALLLLNNTAHDIIAFTSKKPNDSLFIRLQNNFSHSITLDTLYFERGSAFTIDSSSVNLHDPLDSGAIFTIKLRFTANSPGFYTDFIRSPDEPILPISVQGLLLPDDAVEARPTGSGYFSIYPNPSHGEVNIHMQNISKAHLTITDVLGRTFSEASITGDWQWDRRSESGMTAPAGTYFIVLSGTDRNGASVQEVERVVLE
jgi:hypothetical protein